MLDFLRHAPWGRYLRLSAGAPTSRVALWVTPRGISGAINYRNAVSVEPDLSVLPELPPFVEGGQGSGKGAFLSRLKKRVPMGARPSLLVFLDTPQAFIRLVSTSDLPAKSVEALLETLQSNAREVFPSIEQEYRWTILDPSLKPLKGGRLPNERLIIVGLQEDEASEVESWARAQGFILDAILPASVGTAVFLLEAFQNMPAAGGDACFVIGTAVNTHRLVIERSMVNSWEIQAAGIGFNLITNVDELFGEHPALRDALQWLWEFENPEEEAPLTNPSAQRLANALTQTLSWWISV